ncbi:MAG: F0F1 ATP synthase subunit B [Pseudomonadota bacterium]|nr:F0F1 ATP synthase subunit B [Pseudomonadota bacterium]
MQIDWFTVGAQVVNFLILVYLLKRFLYGPIIHAMAQREQTIADRLEDAKRQSQNALAAEREYQARTQDLEQTRSRYLGEARDEAEKARETLIEQARSDVDQLRQRWKQQLSHERLAFFREVRQTVGRQSCAIARRTIAELADTDLQSGAVRMFCHRLNDLEPAERNAVAAAMQATPPTVETALPLAEADRRDLAAALATLSTDGPSPRFEVNPDLICGIALMMPGKKLTWSAADYVDELERELTAVLGSHLDGSQDEIASA